MATEGGGKMKNKRHKDPETPYSRRRSLLGQVTDTVKGVIGGGWLTNLVNSVRKTPPKEVGSQEAKTDGSSGKGSYPSYPKVPNQGGSFLMTPGREVAPNVDPMTYNPAQVPYTPYMQMAQHVMVNGADRRTDYPGTPGFSPVVVGGAETPEYPSNMLHLNDSRLQQLRQEFQHGVPHSTLVADQSSVAHPGKLNLGETTVTADEGSFLWSTKPRRPSETQPQVPSKVTKASFNASVFGTSIGDRSVLSGTLGGQSPFYPGKTAFGGAASHRRPQATTAPYQLPSRKLVASKPLKQNKAGGVSSSTAKKILETLDKMSSPLADAKKIPTHDPSASLLITPVRKRTLNKPKVDEGPPTQQITPIGFASIAPNKSIFNKSTTSRKSVESSAPKNKTEEDHSVPMSNVSSQKSAPQTSPNPVNFGAGKASGKMRREKGSHHYSSKTVDEDEHVEVPDLPTNFTLPLSGNLPMFSFAGPVNTSSNATPVTSGHNGFGSSAVTKPAARGNDNFKFSSPIAKAIPSSSVHSTTPNNFEFSSPIRVQESQSGNDGSNKSTVSAVGSQPMFGSGPVMKTGDLSGAKMKPFSMTDSTANDESTGFQPAKELKQGSVMDILGKSQSSGSLKPATELKKGSVMDVLGKPSGGIQPASVLKTGSVMDILKKSPGQFGADSKANSSSPPASSTASLKPAAEPAVTQPTVPPPAVSGGFGNMFSKPSGTWECDACMIQNKLDVTKCAACETPKPGVKPPVIQPPAGLVTGGFGMMFNKPTGTWECEVCMVGNKSDLTKCAACETPKPGAKPAPSMPAPSMPAPSMPAVPAPSSGFGGFGLKPASSTWECNTCLVMNKPEANKCIACETPKPGAKQTTGFTSPGGFKFGSSGGLKLPTAASGSTTTPNFGSSAPNFGTAAPMPAASTTPSTGGFKFSSASDDKAKEVKTVAPASGGFKFGGSSESDKPSNGGFSLTTSTTKEKSEDKPAAFGGFKLGGTTSPAAPATKIDDSAPKAESKPALGGFKTSDKTDSSPALGGFQFNAKDSKGTSVPAAGGFKFGAPAVSAKDNAAATDAKSATAAGSAMAPGLFSFSKTDSVTAPESKVEPSKPAMPSASLFSGTNSQITTPKTESSSTATPSAPFSTPFSGSGFQFGSTTNSDKGGFAFSATSTKGTESLGKRTRDEADGPSDAKKSFAFGSQTNTSAAPSTNFKFGETAPPATTSASTAPSLFSFSATSNKTDTPAPAAPAGVFGSTSFGGTTSSQAASTPFANTGFGTTNTSLFGSSTSQPKESAPAPAGGLFGAPAAAAPVSNAASSGFQFGTTTVTNSKGLFQFGSNDNRPQTNIATNSAPLGSSNGNTGFAFGQAAPASSDAPQFNFTAQPSGFNFGANSTAGTIQFGAGGTDTNTFSMGRAPSSNPQAKRQIKRAVRKIRK